MSRRKQTEFLGVKILLIPTGYARVTRKVIVTGHAAWMLLPDGSVGTTETDFFRWAHMLNTRTDARAAEALWRLGAIRKPDYLAVLKAANAKDESEALKHNRAEFRDAAKRLGITLSKEQAKIAGAD